ncbi:hypothetical protein [Microcoleus sp. B7-D4]|uniref:hypothetical protein n=1 Tax=Microcoleus sp. B7-D4 TaxID=2818696 RepID=UPI002FD0F708
MLNKILKFLAVKVACRIPNVRFLPFANQAAAKPQIVEELPAEEGLVYEYKEWDIIIYKEGNLWKWFVRAGCIIFIESCASTKEEAIVSAEAWVDRYPED